jgi:hypothetical protein
MRRIRRTSAGIWQAAPLLRVGQLTNQEWELKETKALLEVVTTNPQALLRTIRHKEVRAQNSRSLLLRHNPSLNNLLNSHLKSNHLRLSLTSKQLEKRKREGKENFN